MKAYLNKKRALIDKELDRLLPGPGEHPPIIHRAMRHVLKGGKRIRPILCLLSAEALGKKSQLALKTACAIEMIHTYSLIHDDLPSMDNDDYRRGRQSCHKKFGLANAILAGDALLTLGFGVLSKATPYPARNCAIIDDLSRACGTFGMIGGQVVDISPQEKNLLTMEYVNIHKTGALIASSCKTAAIAVGANKKETESLFRFGEYVGLAFQMIDDILDNEGMAKLYGPKRAYENAAELIAKAKARVSCFGKKKIELCRLADLILNRKR